VRLLRQYLSKLLLRRRRGQRARTYAFFQRLIDGLPDSFYLKDADSRYVMVNKAFTRERGCTPEELIGRTTVEVLGPAARDAIADDRAALQGLPVSKEQVVEHPVTGEQYFRVATKRRVEDEDGEPLVIGYHQDITHWRVAERELQVALGREKGASELTRQFVQRLLDALPMPIYIKDADSRYLLVNETQTREWQRPAEEFIGRTSMSLAPNAEIAKIMREEDLAVLAGGSVYKEEANHHPVTGKDRYRVVTKGLCTYTDGRPVILCTMFDTTAWRTAESDLKTALERETELRKRTQTFVQRLIDVIPDPFYVKSAAGRFIIVNEAHASEKRTPKEDLVAFDSYVLEPSDAAAEELRKEDREVVAGAQVDKEEHSGAPGSGGERFRRVVKRRSEHIDGSPVIVGAHFDITRWKVAERELERVAYEDSLTGLANRRYFLAEAERAAARADRHGQALSLLLFDLDHFKRINDEHGHQSGDEVLREVAGRTRKSLRTEDMPARWGGEEFVALLPLTALPEAALVANRLRLAIAATPIATSAGPLPVTLSCGIAQRRRAEPVLDFIARADAALYQAKDSGRNACVAAPV
jgi:diguanylate cyclase (GGDEF)-like protein/PAS domain S-box-containing protein